MTLVVIAHRLATVMHSDQVFFLDDGILLASGTFEEVRKSVPQFEKQASLLGM
jgi:ABC-type multidrug transport system fused ATPase/permease subunit